MSWRKVLKDIVCPTLGVVTLIRELFILQEPRYFPVGIAFGLIGLKLDDALVRLLSARASLPATRSQSAPPSLPSLPGD